MNIDEKDYENTQYCMLDTLDEKYDTMRSVLKEFEKIFSMDVPLSQRDLITFYEIYMALKAHVKDIEATLDTLYLDLVLYNTKNEIALMITDHENSNQHTENKSFVAMYPKGNHA